MKHIYTRLGFMPRNDLIQLNLNSKSLQIKRQGMRSTLSGPERIATIHHLIGALVPKQLMTNTKTIHTYTIERDYI